MSENEFTLGRILKELKRIADALERINNGSHDMYLESAGEKLFLTPPRAKEYMTKTATGSKPTGSKEADVIHSKPAPKKQKFNKKGPYKISTKPCKQCGGLISWDLYPDRKGPLHVDSEGFPIGNGDCPNYNPEE